ncbi:MAG: trypsin-like peptidase domain-containing protein, partial [Planctomycetaceae bacterium]|nr:trypsin-like peptidase domain-containing protein [Planctomycetaceae bacterium]
MTWKHQAFQRIGTRLNSGIPRIEDWPMESRADTFRECWWVPPPGSTQSEAMCPRMVFHQTRHQIVGLPMTIAVSCQACRKEFLVADEHGGKTIRCPGCRAAVTVGRAKPAPSAPAPKPAPKPKPAARRSAPARSRQESAHASQSYGAQPMYGAAPQPSAPKRSGIHPALLLGGIGGLLAMMAVGGVVVWKVLDSNTAPTVAEDGIDGGANPVGVVNDSVPAADVAVASVPPNMGNPPLAPNSGFVPAPGVGVPAPTPVVSGGFAGGAANGPLDSTNVVEGDRVAWLNAGGMGFVRVGDSWMFRGGQAEAQALRPGSNELTMNLVETMRGTDFIELYSPANHLRFRLTAASGTAHRTRKNESSAPIPLGTGSWHSSTAQVSWRNQPASNDSVSEYLIADSGFSGGTQELIRHIERNVVRVDVASVDGSGNGSGFLMDPSGRIVTNYHVIEGCKTATVLFKGNDGEPDLRFPVDGFLHVDPKRDIAILQVALPDNFRRSGLQLAEAMPPKGAKVIALGAPLGLDFTVSEGIISAHRSADELESTLGLTDHEGNWVQSTAQISPGNSGGPLVDEQGRVVSINTMTLTIGQNLNFGISCDDIRAAAQKSDLVAKTMTPTSVPVVIAQRGSGNAGAA